MSQELREIADTGRTGTVSEVARQAADRADRAADWLGEREPGERRRRDPVVRPAPSRRVPDRCCARRGRRRPPHPRRRRRRAVTLASTQWAPGPHPVSRRRPTVARRGPACPCRPTRRRPRRGTWRAATPPSRPGTRPGRRRPRYPGARRAGLRPDPLATSAGPAYEADPLTAPAEPAGPPRRAPRGDVDDLEPGRRGPPQRSTRTAPDRPGGDFREFSLTSPRPSARDPHPAKGYPGGQQQPAPHPAPPHPGTGERPTRPVLRRMGLQ